MARKPNPKTAASANKNLVNYTNKTTNYIDKTFKYPNQTYTVIANGITGQTQTVSGIVPGSTKVKGSDGTYHYVANPNSQYGSTTNPYMDQLQTVNQNLQNQNAQQQQAQQGQTNVNVTGDTTVGQQDQNQQQQNQQGQQSVSGGNDYKELRAAWEAHTEKGGGLNPKVRAVLRDILNNVYTTVQ